MPQLLTGLTAGLGIVVFAPQAAPALLLIAVIVLAVFLWGRYGAKQGKRRGAKKSMPPMRQSRRKA